MTTKIGHGLERGAQKQVSLPGFEKIDEQQQKINKMRNSKEYQAMLKKNIDWLTQLDATDSKPNNGRLDISVFNAKVSQFGYNATPDIVGYPRHGIYLPRYSEDVDIQKQAQSMTDKYYSKKFGL